MMTEQSVSYPNFPLATAAVPVLNMNDSEPLHLTRHEKGELQWHSASIQAAL